MLIASTSFVYDRSDDPAISEYFPQGGSVLLSCSAAINDPSFAAAAQTLSLLPAAVRRPRTMHEWLT